MTLGRRSNSSNSNSIPTDNGMISTIQMMAAAMREQVEATTAIIRKQAVATKEQAAATERLTQCLQKVKNEIPVVKDQDVPQGNQVPAHESGIAMPTPIPNFHGLAEFRKNKLKLFEGEYNLAVADKWLEEIEKIFKVMGYINIQKVAFTTYMLIRDAYNWWKENKQVWEAHRIEIT